MLLVAALAIVLPAAAAPCCGAMAVQKSAPMMSHPCCAPHCTMKVGSDTQQENDAVLTPASNFQTVLLASDFVTTETAFSVADTVSSALAGDLSPPASAPSSLTEQLRI